MRLVYLLKPRLLLPWLVQYKPVKTKEIDEINGEGAAIPLRTTGTGQNKVCPFFYNRGSYSIAMLVDVQICH